MATGDPGDRGDIALVHVVEVSSSPIGTAIIQHLETMADIVQENGLSIGPVTSCPVLPMVRFL